MTTRRGFLASILAAGVAPAAIGSGVLMPVRQIWTPVNSLKMGNTLLTPQMIIKEALEILQKECGVSHINKSYEFSEWGNPQTVTALNNMIAKFGQPR